MNKIFILLCFCVVGFFFHDSSIANAATYPNVSGMTWNPSTTPGQVYSIFQKEEQIIIRINTSGAISYMIGCFVDPTTLYIDTGYGIFYGTYVSDGRISFSHSDWQRKSGQMAEDFSVRYYAMELEEKNKKSPYSAKPVTQQEAQKKYAEYQSAKKKSETKNAASAKKEVASGNSASQQNSKSVFCYTAILKKEESSFGARSVHTAALFVEITVMGSRTKDEIMRFGRQKISTMLNGYQISSEFLDSSIACRQCKEKTAKNMVLDDFQILYETMR